MREFTPKERQQLVTVLRSVPGVDDPGVRRALVRDVSEELRTHLDVPYSDTTGDHLRDLVRMLLVYPVQRAAVVALAEALRIRQEGSDADLRLLAAFDEICARPAPDPWRLLTPPLSPEREQTRVGPATRTSQPISASLRATRDAILYAVDASQPARIDIVADSGCGKTLLLEELGTALQGRDHLTLSLTAPLLDSTPDPHDFLRGTQSACEQLIRAMADDVVKAYEPLDGSVPWLDRAAGNRVFARLLVIAGEVQQVSLAGDRQEAGAALTRALDQASRRLAEVLDAVTEFYRVSVLVDDLHTIAATPAGRWLAETLGRSNLALVAFARRPAAPQEEASAQHALGLLNPRRVELKEMTRQETEARVVHQLTLAMWQRERAVESAGIIYRATRGLPIGVVTCCEILAEGELPPNASAAEVRATILGGDKRWDDPKAITAIRRSIESSIRRLLDRPADRPVEIFDHLVVIRRCTRELLAALLTPQGLTEQQVAHVYEWLGSRAYVTAIDEDAKLGWRLHDFLRENVGARLRQDDPERFQDLHKPVEAYYRTVVNLDQDRDAASPYIVGARYEDPFWQLDSQEWMHHAALLNADDFDATRNALIRLFLEAWWWWDAEVPVGGYCERLLDSFTALLDTMEGSPDRSWLTCLRELRENFVATLTSRDAAQARERSRRSDRTLNRLLRMLDLHLGEPPEENPLRRIYIIVCALHGDTTWYGSSGRPVDRGPALRWLRAAEAACTRHEELWIGNWAVWRQARLWLSSEPEPDRAADLLPRLARGIEEQADNELRVYLIQLYGDLKWHVGDHALALDIYARSVLHGFVYNIRQEVEQQAPNQYGRSLYAGACAHLRQQLAELAGAGRTGLVRRATARTRRYFDPYWDHVVAEPEPDNQLGLPPGPEAEELGSLDNDFAEGAIWVLRNMGEQLAEPLDGPLGLADRESSP